MPKNLPTPPNVVPDIFVMSADGSSVKQITFCRAPCVTGNERPAWSPDGTRIAFVSGNEIRTMDPDGTHQSLVYRHPLPALDQPICCLSW